MAEITKKPIKITETILRDAHQSLIATRMTTEQMLPIVEKMDKVGYHSVECWGGATFDASLRFLKEDPWERLRKFRDGFKNTKLQMLFRGQNILGYRPYADDVVEYFVQKSVANGMDIIRIFDCLNDMRNLRTAVKAAVKEGADAQVALSYTLGDAYTMEYWMDIAKRIEDMGATSICLKDMAGLLVPYKATEIISALKDVTDLPIQLHTHYTSGVASMTYLKAVEAGVDVIDTAMSPFALGTSQPATEVMVETFKGTPYDSGLDQNLLAEIADYFRPLRDEALESGLVSAYKKEFGESRTIAVRLNEEKGTIKVYAHRLIVEEVEDEASQISLEEAREIKENAQVGEVIVEDITPKDFSRIAAQTARQVVMQRLNDAKKEYILNEMNEKQGEIVGAIVRRKEGNNVYVEISGTQMEGVMMQVDQVPTETYNLNDMIKVYVKKIRETLKGAQVIVSRSAAGFVRRLFELEVPEIKAGLVKIAGCVREAGFRTKIAVYSEDPNVDAVGACIGNKGIRVNEVVQELGGEKIDVVEYCADPIEYIARALSPAQVLMVSINEEEKHARVIVSDEKLSLAIGRNGQNARLAAKLTGWKIDVKPASTLKTEEENA